MLFFTKYESNLIVHGFCSPSHYNWGWGGGGGGDLRLKGRYIKYVGGVSEGFCGGHEIF